MNECYVCFKKLLNNSILFSGKITNEIENLCT